MEVIQWLHLLWDPIRSEFVATRNRPCHRGPCGRQTQVGTASTWGRQPDSTVQGDSHQNRVSFRMLVETKAMKVNCFPTFRLGGFHISFVWFHTILATDSYRKSPAKQTHSSTPQLAWPEVSDHGHANFNCERVAVPHSADFCSSMTAGFGPDPALEVLEGLSINCSGRGTADFVGQGGLAEGIF